MSKISIHNIIKSTLRIDRLTHEQLKACVFELLEKNPTLVSKHFIGIKVEKKNVTPVNTNTESSNFDKIFYVVFTSMPNDKIRVIRAIRSFLFCGLADSKNWVEGRHVSNMPLPGVLAGPVDTLDAKVIFEKMEKIDSDLTYRLSTITKEEYNSYKFKHF